MSKREDYTETRVDGLAACPFCGATGDERTPDGLINSRGLMLRRRDFLAWDAVPMTSYFIVCHGCGCKGPTRANEEHAIKAWCGRVS